MALVVINWEKAKEKLRPLVEKGILDDETIELIADFVDALVEFRGITKPAELADRAFVVATLKKLRDEIVDELTQESLEGEEDV